MLFQTIHEIRLKLWLYVYSFYHHNNWAYLCCLALTFRTNNLLGCLKFLVLAIQKISWWGLVKITFIDCIYQKLMLVKVSLDDVSIAVRVTWPKYFRFDAWWNLECSLMRSLILERNNCQSINNELWILIIFKNEYNLSLKHFSE